MREKILTNHPFTCSKCDSDNVKLIPSFPGGKIAGTLARLFKFPPARMKGRYMIQCKDCGHESTLFVD